jgi:Flp pilus assembly protein TadD
MAEIVNLRMARKARQRAEAERTAAQNRAKFGRTKAQKAKERADAERAARAIDGARRADAPRDSEPEAGSGTAPVPASAPDHSD